MVILISINMIQIENIRNYNYVNENWQTEGISVSAQLIQYIVMYTQLVWQHRNMSKTNKTIILINSI